jgi:hypothetical protein
LNRAGLRVHSHTSSRHHLPFGACGSSCSHDVTFSHIACQSVSRGATACQGAPSCPHRSLRRRRLTARVRLHERSKRDEHAYSVSHAGTSNAGQTSASCRTIDSARPAQRNSSGQTTTDGTAVRAPSALWLSAPSVPFAPQRVHACGRAYAHSHLRECARCIASVHMPLPITTELVHT